MIVRSRYYLVAVLMLIPLAARGQNGGHFDRGSVLARWREASEASISGRTEWTKESYVSREGGQPKFRQTDSVRVSFNPNGFAFSYSVEEYGDKTLSQNSLTIVNEKYTAKLRKAKGEEGWLLADSRPKGKGEASGKKWSPDWLLCGNVALPDWISDPSFAVTRSGLTGAGLIRVSFACDVSKRKSPDLPEHIKSGYITFDPEHSYCPRDYEYQISTKFSQQTETGVMDYEFRGEIPLLKAVSTDTAIRSEKHGLAKSSTKWTYKVQYNVHVPDEEFRLSFYDLPEPMGVQWPKPTRWWLWLSLAALGAVAIGFLFVKVRKRYLAAQPAKS